MESETKMREMNLYKTDPQTWETSLGLPKGVNEEFGVNIDTLLHIK